MKIGATITKLRNKKGLTQDQMADILGVKRARYNSWENDIAKPDIEMIRQIALYHKVTTDYILEMPSSEFERNEHCIDLASIFESKEITYNGMHLSDEEKSKMKRVLEALF